MKIKYLNGMTLVETMVATIIFMFIMAGLYATLLAGSSSWESYDLTVRTQQEARKAITAMSRDLRVAGTLSFTTNTSTDVVFTFTHPSDGSVTYSWSTTGANANRIIRTINATMTTRTIALNIFSFAVTDSATDITLDLTATVQSAQGRSSSFRLEEKVAKR